MRRAGSGAVQFCDSLNTIMASRGETGIIESSGRRLDCLGVEGVVEMIAFRGGLLPAMTVAARLQ